jgi:predicted RNA-binding Zn-ribbon protein involved in translation (DUF1610 family)
MWIQLAFTVLIYLVGGVSLIWLVVYFARRHPPRHVSLRFCPNCGSQQIELVDRGLLNAFYFPAASAVYRCTTCDYTSTLFPSADDEDELATVQESLHKR